LIAVDENKTTNRGFVRLTPNPVRTNARISKGQSAKGIELHIYDVSGSLIRSFTLGPMPSALSWDCTDQTGRLVPAGEYFLETLDRGEPIRIKFTVAR
jgi:flagellar hook assembly protein FlgD